MEQYAKGAMIGELDDLNPDGFTALRDALELGPSTREGSFASLKAFITGPCGGVFASDADGATPLHWAARHEHTEELVRWLIVEKGASPDGLTAPQLKRRALWRRSQKAGVAPATSSATSSCGASSSLAVAVADDAAVSTLVASDAAPSPPPAFNDGVPTPLHEAARYDHAAIAELLLTLPRPRVASSDAAATSSSSLEKGGALATIRSIIPKAIGGSGADDEAEVGADPNAADSAGVRPLHVCAVWNNARTASVLLRHGADPLAPAADGQTPIDWAMPGTAVGKLLADAAAELAQ